MSYKLMERAKLDEKTNKNAAKKIEILKSQVADLSKVESLKKVIFQSRLEMETMKKAYEEVNGSFERSVIV